MEQAFVALGSIRNTANYDKVCQQVGTDCYTDGGGFLIKDSNGNATRLISSTARVFNHSITVYQSQTRTQAELLKALSIEKYPDGVLVDVKTVLGNSKFDENAGIVVLVKLYIIRIAISRVDGAAEFEEVAINKLRDMGAEWCCATPKPFSSTFSTKSHSLSC